MAPQLCIHTSSPTDIKLSDTCPFDTPLRNSPRNHNTSNIPCSSGSHPSDSHSSDRHPSDSHLLGTQPLRLTILGRKPLRHTTLERTATHSDLQIQPSTQMIFKERCANLEPTRHAPAPPGPSDACARIRSSGRAPDAQPPRVFSEREVPPAKADWAGRPHLRGGRAYGLRWAGTWAWPHLGSSGTRD